MIMFYEQRSRFISTPSLLAKPDSNVIFTQFSKISPRRRTMYGAYTSDISYDVTRSVVPVCSSP
jgi:hypothetical protein